MVRGDGVLVQYTYRKEKKIDYSHDERQRQIEKNKVNSILIFANDVHVVWERQKEREKEREKEKEFFG